MHHLESVLLLMAVAYPAGAGMTLLWLVRAPAVGWALPQSASIANQIFKLLVGYMVLVALTALTSGIRFLEFSGVPGWGYVFFAPVVGIAAIAFEYLVSMGHFLIRTGRLVTRVEIGGDYASAPAVRALDVLAILSLVIAEEFFCRRLVYDVMLNDLSASLEGTLAFSALAYALIHIRFGFVSTFSKVGSGLMYALLYHFSGLSLLAVVTAHATQNLTLLVLARTRRAIG